MLATLILAAAAGWLAPKAEETVKGAIESVLLAEAPITPVELRLMSFAVCLVGAAILSMIFGEPHALALAVGAASRRSRAATDREIPPLPATPITTG